MPSEPETLEGIGRRSGLVGASAQHIRSGFQHFAGSLANGTVAFNRARAGDHDDFLSADFDAADIDDGIFRMETCGWPACTAGQRAAR